MKINISGSIETGQNFSMYVEEECNKTLSKYFDSIPLTEVHLKKQADKIYCSIVSTNIFTKGDKITADAEDYDARKTFDEALKKLITQFKTEKSKALTKKKQG